MAALDPSPAPQAPRGALSRRRLLALAAAGCGSVLLSASGGSAAGTPATPTAAGNAAVGAGPTPAQVAKPAAAATSSLPAQAPPKQGQTLVKMMTRGDDYIFKLFRKQYDEFAKSNPDI